MRPSDLQKLSVPFEAADAEDANAQLCVALGVSAPALHALREAIEADVDDRIGGVCWWKDHIDCHRRILITEHMLAALHSIQENLAEAALHELEYRDAVEEISKRMARFVLPDRSYRMPKPTRALDLLPDKREDLHAAGAFRAVGSAMDCLAAVVIGVLAIPQDILKADFPKAVRWLRAETNRGAERQPFQTDFVKVIDDMISAAGPSGWLSWADDYRNMFVHRGRRTALSMLDVEAHVLGADGAPIPCTKVQPLLLADPAASTVESWVQFRSRQITLTEPAQVTMSKLIVATTSVVNGCAENLLRVWRLRSAQNGLCRQPEAQWPEVVLSSRSTFTGFLPGTVDVQPDAMISNTADVRRLTASRVAVGPSNIWHGADSEKH